VTILSGAFEFFDDEQIAFGAMGVVAAPVAAVASTAARGGRWKQAPVKLDPCRGITPSEKLVQFAHDVAEKIVNAKKPKFLPQDPLSVPRTLDPDKVRQRDLKILRARISELQRDQKADRKEIAQLWELIRNLECVIFQREREIAAYQRYMSSVMEANRRMAGQVETLKTQTSELADTVAVLESKVTELQVENAVLKVKTITLDWEQATPWFLGAIGSLVVSFFLPSDVRPIGYVVSGACGTIGLLKL
jgi:hypothetical protein